MPETTADAIPFDPEREYWESWLPPRLSQRLDQIRKKVESLYAHQAGQYQQPAMFTPHGPAHCRAVEDRLHELIPHESYKRLNESERFFLLASAWLHDLGMIRGILPGDEKRTDDQIREDHHRRSEQYLHQEYDTVGVAFHEAAFFGLLARLHRRRCSLEEAREGETPVPGHDPIRLRLLAAYLRLADALHVDTTRVESGDSAIPLALEMPSAARLHWLRSVFVSAIKPDAREQKHEIVVHVKSALPGDDPAETERMNRIVDRVAELVVDDLSSELDTVKDTLTDAGISYFLRVRCEKQSVALPRRLQRDLASAMNEYFLLDNPSSSMLFSLVLESLYDRIALQHPDVDRDIKNFLTEVDRLVSSRGRHAALTRLLGSIRQRWERDQDPIALRSWIEEQRHTWHAKRVALTDHATRYLVQAMGRPGAERNPATQPYTILLYGYSEQVIEALKGFRRAMAFRLLEEYGERYRRSVAPGSSECVERMPGDPNAEAAERFRIFVCEAQPKNRTGWGGRVLFHDGYKYATTLSNAGFRNIHIIPDAIACTLMLPNARIRGMPNIDFLKPA